MFIVMCRGLLSLYERLVFFVYSYNCNTVYRGICENVTGMHARITLTNVLGLRTSWRCDQCGGIQLNDRNRHV